MTGKVSASNEMASALLRRLSISELAQPSQENWVCGLRLDRDALREAGAAEEDLPRTGENRLFTIIDSPGGDGHFRRVYDACAQADAALMIVSAVPGEVESCIDQVRRYATAALTAGIRSFVVAVSKMDEHRVGYSSNRFSEISGLIQTYFESRLKNTAFCVVPISSISNENITRAAPLRTKGKMPWFNGPSLVAALAAICPSDKRSGDEAARKPLRIAVQRCFRVYNVPEGALTEERIKNGGLDYGDAYSTVAVGRVEAGILRKGMRVVIGPNCVESEVLSIEQHYTPIDQAYPGDNVGFALKNIFPTEVKRGYIVGSSTNNPPRPAKTFVAQILVLNQPFEIAQGACYTMDIHAAHVGVRFLKLHSRLIGKDRTRDVKDIHPDPKFLRPTERGMVTLQPLKPVVLEENSTYYGLGRFSIRAGERMLACGVIKKVMYDDEPAAVLRQQSSYYEEERK
eukprot:CAMPEP_0197528174 /NCGR_PEP_ID=MMETSP1318-20131121/24156_1 /TAXON_ID=552666 /ORGANISM="Partenskyella glossopodia, Strain RCC365" /LENGTH=457 /DNA_ID=CAMNT_0043083155 /DNA_START=55 /DNA_END=1428 /DNA_ORIENTATION=+